MRASANLGMGQNETPSKPQLSPCVHLPGFHFGYLFLTHKSPRSSPSSASSQEFRASNFASHGEKASSGASRVEPWPGWMALFHPQATLAFIGISRLGTSRVYHVQVRRQTQKVENTTNPMSLTNQRFNAGQLKRLSQVINA